MQADSRRELHKVAHRRIDKPGTGRCRHIDVGVHYHRPFPTVNYPPINAGNVIEIFVGDAKRSGRSQVTRASGGNRRLHDAAVVVKEVGFLLCEVELHGVLSEGHSRQTPEHHAREDKTFRTAEHYFQFPKHAGQPYFTLMKDIEQNWVDKILNPSLVR